MSELYEKPNFKEEWKNKKAKTLSKLFVSGVGGFFYGWMFLNPILFPSFTNNISSKPNQSISSVVLKQENGRLRIGPKNLTKFAQYEIWRENVYAWIDAPICINGKKLFSEESVEIPRGLIGEGVYVKAYLNSDCYFPVKSNSINVKEF